MLIWMAAGSFKTVLHLSGKPRLLFHVRIIIWDVFMHHEVEE